MNKTFGCWLILKISPTLIDHQSERPKNRRRTFSYVATEVLQVSLVIILDNLHEKYKRVTNNLIIVVISHVEVVKKRTCRERKIS
jgi:hypothetical protein